VRALHWLRAAAAELIGLLVDDWIVVAGAALALVTTWVVADRLHDFRAGMGYLAAAIVWLALAESLRRAGRRG
jgi:hypothetical protein